MSGESSLHRDTKKDIYTTLLKHPACSDCKMERSLTKTRPDISLYIRGKPVAIEIQKSSLSIDAITTRMHHYSKDGIFTLWLLPTEPDVEWIYDDETDDLFPAYRASKWEKFLHAMYFGRIYWHWGGAKIIPWHLGKQETWVESREWFDVDEGEWKESGGYFKTSKVLKSVTWPGSEPYRKLNIANDFRAITRQSWRGGSMTIPASKIWIDKLPKWW